MPKRIKLSTIGERIATIYESKVAKPVRDATKNRITENALKLITKISDDQRIHIMDLLKEGEEKGRSVIATSSTLLKTGLDKGVFRSARSRAYLIARTELHRARQRAACDIYKEAKIDLVKWVVVGDNRLCEVCKARAKTYKLKDIEDSLPPEHPRCRCFIDSQVRIYTSDGWKQLKNIKVGDLVLTHKGRFRKVTKLIKIPRQEVEMVSLYTEFPNTNQTNRYANKLSVTSEHPVLVGGRWVEAKDVKVGDKIRFLANRCRWCETLVPYFKEFCTPSCQSKWITKNQWGRSSHRELMTRKISISSKRMYAADPELGSRLTKKAHEKTREMVEDGTHPFFDIETRRKAMSSLGKLGKIGTYIENELCKSLSEFGLSFDRQYPISKGRGYYYVDIAFPELKVAVECDGDYWHKDKDLDQKRQSYIESLGWSMLRFTGSEIKKDSKSCAEKVIRILQNHQGDYQFIDVPIIKVDYWKPKTTYRVGKNNGNYKDGKHCQQVISVSPVGRKTLYNLDVEEDESFIAKGWTVHNCRVIPSDFQFTITTKKGKEGKVVTTKILPTPKDYLYVVKLKKSIEGLEKAGFHKYIRREGVPGKYVYYYQEVGKRQKLSISIDDVETFLRREMEWSRRTGRKSDEEIALSVLSDMADTTDVKKYLEFVSGIFNEISERLKKVRAVDVKGVPITLFFDERNLKYRLLTSRELTFRKEEIYPIPVYVSADGDENTIGLMLDKEGKFEMFEGNEEATSRTLDLVNDLLGVGGKEVVVWTSQPVEVVEKIKRGEIPSGIFVSPDRSVAQAYWGEGRDLVSFKIPMKRLAQHGDVDWQVRDLEKSMPHKYIRREGPSGAYTYYYKDVSEVPLLTKEQEAELFQKKDFNKLVRSNLRFVVKIAQEYRNSGVPIPDLIQEGNIGLIEAIKRFDPSKGTRLSTYAVFWIRAYIRNYIRKRGRESGIETELPEEEGSKTLQQVGPSPEDLAYEKELTVETKEALSKLNANERYVIINRVMADDPVTLVEAGKVLNLSNERVRQIEREALKKLHTYMAPIQKAKPYGRMRMGRWEHVKGYQSKPRLYDLAPQERVQKYLIDPSNPQVVKAFQIAGDIQSVGGHALFVGGSVRDALLGRRSKDVDVEVYGVKPEELSAILERHGKISQVGKSFGVFKVSTDSGQIDVSIPRRESKVGKGHKGFMTEHDPSMTYKEAAGRRDLTINALAYDPISKTIIDEYNGIQDIKTKTLRATDPETFGDDSLRVLRVMRFAAQLGFTPDVKLAWMCRQIDLTDLPKERVFGELEGMLLKSKHPSIGLMLIPILGIDKILPELTQLRGVEQEPDYHPEGDAWSHTLLVVDEAAKMRDRLPDPKERLILMLAALCHDLGKPETTEEKGGKIISYGHDEAGANITREFLSRLTDDQYIIDKTESLVRNHMRPTMFYQDRVPDSAIRRLAKKVDIPMVVMVSAADKAGRGLDKIDLKAERWVMSRYKALGLEHPEALDPQVKGRHLIPLGIEPGPDMGRLLDKIYNAQLDGKFKTTDEGIEYARSQGWLEILEKSYDYSSTQVELPKTLAQKVLDLEKLIDKDDLHPTEKQEDAPHITVRYGLHTNLPDEVKRILEGIGPIKATFVGIDVFQPEGKDYDVLVLRADSPDLSKLNSTLASLPSTTTFKFYQPHTTIAYLKRDRGQKYKDMVTGLEGEGIEFIAVTFSPKEGDKVDIPLKKSEVKGHYRMIHGKRVWVKPHSRIGEPGFEPVEGKATVRLSEPITLPGGTVIHTFETIRMGRIGRYEVTGVEKETGRIILENQVGREHTILTEDPVLVEKYILQEKEYETTKAYLKKTYNLKDIEFAEESDRYESMEKLRAELEWMSDKVVVDGRGVLGVKVVTLGDLGECRALYFRKDKEIEISKVYTSSFAHEYGHFVFFESLHAAALSASGAVEDAYFNPIVEHILKYHTEGIEAYEGSFETTLALFLQDHAEVAQEAFTKGTTLYLERLKNLVPVGSVEYAALSELYTGLAVYYSSKFPGYRNIFDWSYVFQPTEIFARAYHVYVHGEPDISLPGFENDRDYINLVKTWGDKYLKTGLIKAESVMKVFEDLRKSVVRLTIDPRQARSLMSKIRRLRKSREKIIPWRLGDDVVWATCLPQGYMIKKREVSKGDEILVKSDTFAKVTAVGRDGIIARDESSKKYQILNGEFSVLIRK